ncbi:Eukaryotic translation initiation factor 3 subunit L [Linum perenne]
MAANYDYDEAPSRYDDQAASNRQQEVGGYDPNFVPDSVKSFVVHLYRHIREKNVYEIHQMYETSFQTLSERLFKDTPWPSVDAVAHYVDNDHVFCLLYREMWFRHLYARLSPTLKQRIDSWDNYCSLFQRAFFPMCVVMGFQVVLHGVVNMQLPNQWLWDMVDEFVYQFQSFCQFRAKMKTKTEQEIALLRQFDQAWNVYGVLNFLQALVEKSAIIQILEQEKEGIEQFTATDGYDYSGGSNVLKVLGYFSMIGLLRVHCLLGDYHTGLKCLQPIDISQQGVYTSVIGSHITTIYHYGFANLMLRRYVDGIREFNKILLYIYKTKQYHQKSPQYEQILKKNEQMYALLAIGLSLCPQLKLVEETVNSQLREKYGEKMGRMQRYDDEAFAMYDELFSYACPKFITPSAPSFDEPLVNYNQDAYRLQLKLFLYEVKQQQLLSGVRTFLKVYSTISLGKLANYLEVDEPTLRTILMAYKHKTHAVDSNGKVISNADVDFYIDDDMLRVVDSKPVKRYGDFFLRQIVKLEGVMTDLDRIKLE